MNLKVNNIISFFILYTIRLIIYTILIVVIGLKGEKEKSSHYGLYVLGFTCATRVKTMRHKRVILSKSLKITKVRIKG